MIRESVVKGLAALVAFLLAVGLVGYHFEHELAAMATRVVETVGFPGLCLILLVSDTFVTPFPPDLLLLVVATSPLSADWVRLVGILGVVSAFAGLLGWAFGRWLGHFRWSRRLFGEFKEEHRDFVKRYGFWAVALGAATPLPYSVTCWASGILGVRWEKVLLASLLFRVPRMYLYYWLIAQTGRLAP